MKIYRTKILIMAFLCALLGRNVRAQTTTNEMEITNLCRFALEVFFEGTPKTTNNEITFTQVKPEKFSDTDAKKEINAVTGHSDSSSQVLGKVGWNFWILDKANPANSYMVPSNILSGFYGTRVVKDGTRNNINGLTEGPFEYRKLYTLKFNTFGLPGGHQYDILATGFERKTVIDSKLLNQTLGTFRQQNSATVTKMSGYGHLGSKPAFFKGDFIEKGAGIKQLGSWTGSTPWVP